MTSGVGAVGVEMEVAVAVAADWVGVDKTDRLIVVGVFQEFTIASYPSLIARFSLALQMRASTEEVAKGIQHRLRRIAPGGEEELIAEGGSDRVEIKEPGRPVIINLPAEIVGMPLAEPGLYRFVYTVNGMDVTIPIDALAPVATPRTEGL